ncbi:polyprenyl synthetase family protein [Microbacterium sp. C7(2022)]|uniref:polyprenyl synthetase family protein n=1 Tax=Microbacterium sp. C7(2022) TaxID=2992759 RepID=UPI00237A5C08|nr:polyprenyl synthetase family protein [Microbacterium sp. C7(2022)]MDE0546742.1 polyprenyl synthetase family protein [Microbacterium sp. C7(2022)]
MNGSPAPIEAISQRLESFLSAQHAQIAGFGEEASLLVAAGARAVSGGKRLRGRFAVAGWHAVRGDEALAADDPVAAVAASLEIFHAAALVHDDLIDNSDTRRGRPAAHRALEAQHRESAWSGDADAFGRSSAILLGDLLVAWSDDLFEEALITTPDAAARTTRAEYALMRREVTIGQFLDIAEESVYRQSADDTHAERALRVASLKSARYSIQQPLVIGAALAGGDAEQLDVLRAFGHPLGMAFQLRDDVLGVFGDEKATGKPSGDDLREGKRTVLIAYTRENLSDSDKAVFDTMLGDATLSEARIVELQAQIIDSGALDRVESLITAYVEEAERALKDARVGQAALAELRALAHAAAVRST